MEPECFFFGMSLNLLKVYDKNGIRLPPPTLAHLRGTRMYIRTHLMTTILNHLFSIVLSDMTHPVLRILLKSKRIPNETRRIAQLNMIANVTGAM